jgi:hypothetical protein
MCKSEIVRLERGRVSMNIETKLKKPQPDSKPCEITDEGRREALKKLGIYGVYTAPALLALLDSGKAARASGIMPSRPA